MELLKDVLVDFCLFSLIEGYIFCLFFEKIGGCNKFKWYEIFILSVINCLISIIILPIFYHIFGAFYMGVIIYLKSNNCFKNSLKISFLCLIFIAFIEMIYTISLELILKIDMYKLNSIDRFKYFIFLKIIEVILILIYTKRRKSIMKWFAGEVRK